MLELNLLPNENTGVGFGLTELSLRLPGIVFALYHPGVVPGILVLKARSWILGSGAFPPTGGPTPPQAAGGGDPCSRFFGFRDLLHFLAFSRLWAMHSN